MPHDIALNERIVELKNGNKKILELFENLLNKHCLSKASGKSVLASVDTGLSPGFLNKIKAYLDDVTGTKLSARECTLQKILFSLDPPAYELWQAYVCDLNNQLDTLHIKADKVEAKKIKSRFVLLNELLKRLVALALSTDMRPEFDGDKILALLDEFVTAIDKDSELLKDSVVKRIQRNAKVYEYSFGNTQKKWFTYLEAMVHVIKILRAPSTAFSNALTYFRETRHVITCQLIARLAPRTTPGNLSLDYAFTTLSACEDKLTKGNESSHFKSIALLVPEPSQLTDTQKKALVAVDTSKREKVKSLYVLLNQTETLLKVVEKLDLTITASGWVLLMTGVLNVDLLVQRIDAHWRACENLLTIEGTDPIIKAPVAEGLKKYQALRNLKRPQCISPGQCNNLLALQDRSVLDELNRLVSVQINELIQLQPLLNCPGLITLTPHRVLPAPNKFSESEEVVPPHETKEVEPSDIDTGLLLERTEAILSTIPTALDWKPRTEKMQEENQAMQLDVNNRRIALSVLSETFSKKPVNEQGKQTRIYRFFPDVVLERLMSVDLTQCQPVGRQYDLARSLNSHYYNGRGWGIGPIKEEGIGNKIAGFFETFAFWRKRQAPNNPALEAKPDQVLKREIEDATDRALESAKLK